VGDTSVGDAGAPSDQSAADAHGGKREAACEPGGSEQQPSKQPRVEVPTSMAKSASPAAAPSPSSDELIAAAPKLAAAIRSATKCVKVADKVASLLEDGKMIKVSNASALFDVLAAGVEEPTRWRKAEMRSAFRRLYAAAAGRIGFFSLQQQQSIRLWQLRVVSVCDLLSNHSDAFARGVNDVKTKLQQLPCANPDHEPHADAIAAGCVARLLARAHAPRVVRRHLRVPRGRRGQVRRPTAVGACRREHAHQVRRRPPPKLHAPTAGGAQQMGTPAQGALGECRTRHDEMPQLSSSTGRARW